MLLQSYKITRILPCLADPEKIRVIAEVSGDIYEVFPYLNATLKECIYNHPAFTLTIKKGLKASDIVKLLPGTNCKKCKELSCYAFAFKLIRKGIGITKCNPLFSEEYLEKQEVLLELLFAAGYDVPLDS